MIIGRKLNEAATGGGRGPVAWQTRMVQTAQAEGFITGLAGEESRRRKPEAIRTGITGRGVERRKPRDAEAGVSRKTSFRSTGIGSSVEPTETESGASRKQPAG